MALIIFVNLYFAAKKTKENGNKKMSQNSLFDAYNIWLAILIFFMTGIMNFCLVTIFTFIFAGLRPWALEGGGWLNWRASASSIGPAGTGPPESKPQEEEEEGNSKP